MTLLVMGDPIPEGGCGCRDNGVPVMRANCVLHGGVIDANPIAPSHRPSTANAKKHQEPVGDSAQYRVRVYHSGRWVNHVRPAKARRDPLCQWCAYEGIVKPMKHVDHWVPLAQGGDPYDDANLVSLCHSHHSRKTALERAGKRLPSIVKSAETFYAFA